MFSKLSLLDHQRLLVVHGIEKRQKLILGYKYKLLTGCLAH